MFKKSCPHCFKLIPLRKQWKSHCPHCFRKIRQKSGSKERGAIGIWLEDRGTSFWFFVLLVLLVIAAMIGQVTNHPDLLNFIDSHPVWFALSLIYLAGHASLISRIYYPLLLGAPRILRKERVMIRQYQWLTAIALVLGIGLSLLVIGPEKMASIFPATVFLTLLPLALVWAYLAIVLTDTDYEDERLWSYLTELGASERLDHRHHGFMLLGTIPLAATIFYLVHSNPWIYWYIRYSTTVYMFTELWNRATGRG